MNKKSRFIILAICVALFLVISPYIVMYSMGYRINFETWKVTATGGIYVRTYPQADAIIIDSKISKKPGMFANSVFVQDLMPRQHSVLVKKEGYFDYTKTLQVQEKEVSKIENVTLFKNNIVYSNLIEGVESFSVSPDKKNVLVETSSTKALNFLYFNVSSPENRKSYSLPLQFTTVLETKWSDDSNKALIKTQNSVSTAYYLLDFSKDKQSTASLPYLDVYAKEISFNPQDSSQIFYIKNKTLYSVKNNKSSAIIKNLIAYKVNNGNILWISSDGLLAKSDMTGKLIENMTAKEEALSVYKNYKIDIISGKIFLEEPNDLLTYNTELKTFENFDIKVSNYKILQSPDGKNMIYYNDLNIYVYSFAENLEENNVKLFSSNYPETITNCVWLNNDYIIFESGNKIIASEIDYRGNVNAVEIPQTYPLSADSKTPEVTFNSQDGKVYVLTGGTLYASEKIIP